MAEDEHDQADEPDFEEVVAALLKVDPTGIIGKGRKRGAGAAEGDAGRE